MEPVLVDIPTAISTRGIICVIGVVVDSLAPKRSHGSSWWVTFTLKDRDINNGHTWDGLKIKFFNDDENLFPPVQVGDVISIRNIRIRTFNGQAMGVVSQSERIPWLVFPQGQDPHSKLPITGPTPSAPSKAETRQASHLLREANGVNGLRPTAPRDPKEGKVVQASAAPQRPNKQRQLSLIKDIEERVYVDLVAQVIKTYGNDFEKAIIYVTDYTKNETLLDYNDESGIGREGDTFAYLPTQKKWTGPPRMTLQVTLWEPHASFARENLKLNDIVYLSNVHIRKSRASGNLEASIHGDRQFPKKVLVRTVDAESDDRARDLLRRKNEYWKANGSKRHIEEEVEEATGASRPKRKGKQKPEPKKKETKKEEGQTALTITKTSRIQTNRNVEAAHTGVNPLSIENVIDNDSHENKSPEGIEYRLPFQNLCYRAVVRVVDFFPPNLEDFAVPEDAGSGGSSDHSDGEMDTNDPDRHVRWEWRFCLLVEDASPASQGQVKEQMKLFVSGADAVHLLDFDPGDLRRNKAKLHELQEKLFVIWGDLEEKKRKVAEEGTPMGLISSLPFTCNIKEYGVECAHETDCSSHSTRGDIGCSHEGCFGWERRFAMFQVRVLNR